MVSALDTFLKNSFVEILSNIYAQKIPTNSTAEKIARRYSFQNYSDISKAFTWLSSNFNKDEIMGEGESLIEYHLREIFKFRNKIVHESHYSENLSREKMKIVSDCIFQFAKEFDDFFEMNNYYEQIPLPLNA